MKLTNGGKKKNIFAKNQFRLASRRILSHSTEQDVIEETWQKREKRGISFSLISSERKGKKKNVIGQGFKGVSSEESLAARC